MTDKQAFEKVRDRLVNDAGEIIQLVKQVRNSKDWLPWFALIRILMPIAEAIGDLIYQDSPSQNLVRLFENELVKYKPNYKKVAALIILIFRHSLVHQDEVRSVASQNRTIKWIMSFDLPYQKDHMEIKPDPSDPLVYRIQLDLTQFYQDLLDVCKAKINQPTTGAGARYEQWRELDIDKELIRNKNNKILNKARQELELIFSFSIS